MDKKLLEDLVGKGLSQRDIAKKTGKSHTTIRYWLKKNGLETDPRKKTKIKINNFCKLCGKPDSRRKLCSGCSTKVRRYRAKQAAIKLLGGKCMDCGWSGNIAGFEFHHKDSSQKSFNIGSVANKNWGLIKKELKKCELLCATCHRIKGANNTDSKFLEVVNNYQGGLLDF